MDFFVSKRGHCQKKFESFQKSLPCWDKCKMYGWRRWRSIYEKEKWGRVELDGRANMGKLGKCRDCWRLTLTGWNQHRKPGRKPNSAKLKSISFHTLHWWVLNGRSEGSPAKSFLVKVGILSQQGGEGVDPIPNFLNHNHTTRWFCRKCQKKSQKITSNITNYQKDGTLS